MYNVYITNQFQTTFAFVDTGGKFVTGINNASENGAKFAAGVADTGGKFAAGVVDTGGAP